MFPKPKVQMTVLVPAHRAVRAGVTHALRTQGIDFCYFTLGKPEEIVEVNTLRGGYPNFPGMPLRRQAVPVEVAPL